MQVLQGIIYPNKLHIVYMRDFSGLEEMNLPCWYLHLVVGELEYPNNPESYAVGSEATGRVTLGGQVEG